MRIKTYNAIAQVGLDQFPKDAEVGASTTDAEGILVRSANLHDAEIPESVLAIARAGAGTNNIPVAEMTARGVVVFNTPGANANAVKELVIAGLLLAARNIVPAARFTAGLAGSDAEINEAVEKGKKQFAGFELPMRTLGVVGLGAIGVQVANAAMSLGMFVQGYDPKISVQHAWQLWATAKHVESLDALLGASDVVTVHVPLLDSTKGLINADKLALMKNGAVLLNFSRAGIVDEAAVLAALDSGKLRSYVCDFPSAALLAHPKVTALPHLGASTSEAEDNCAVMAAQELRTYLETGEITNSVNFPQVKLGRSDGQTRLAVSTPTCPTWSAKCRRCWPTPASTSPTWSTVRAAKWPTP